MDSNHFDLMSPARIEPKRDCSELSAAGKMFFNITEPHFKMAGISL